MKYVSRVKPYCCALYVLLAFELKNERFRNVLIHFSYFGPLVK